MGSTGFFLEIEFSQETFKTWGKSAITRKRLSSRRRPFIRLDILDVCLREVGLLHNRPFYTELCARRPGL